MPIRTYPQTPERKTPRAAESSFAGSRAGNHQPTGARRARRVRRTSAQRPFDSRQGRRRTCVKALAINRPRRCRAGRIRHRQRHRDRRGGPGPKRRSRLRRPRPPKPRPPKSPLPNRSGRGLPPSRKQWKAQPRKPRPRSPRRRVRLLVSDRRVAADPRDANIGCPRAHIEQADYLPLFVAPQPVSFEPVDPTTAGTTTPTSIRTPTRLRLRHRRGAGRSPGRATRARGRRRRAGPRRAEVTTPPVTPTPTPTNRATRPTRSPASRMAPTGGDEDSTGTDGGTRRRRRRRRKATCG